MINHAHILAGYASKSGGSFRSLFSLENILKKFVASTFLLSTIAGALLLNTAHANSFEAAPKITHDGVVKSGQALMPNDVVYTYDEKYALVMQSDGNLVFMIDPGKATQNAIWHSNTWGHPGAYFVMQDDGNAVVYDAGQPAKPLWHSNTWGNPGAYFSMFLTQLHVTKPNDWGGGTVIWKAGQEIATTPVTTPSTPTASGACPGNAQKTSYTFCVKELVTVPGSLNAFQSHTVYACNYSEAYNTVYTRTKWPRGTFSNPNPVQTNICR
ncbi:hypothetical protein [Parachitinimonas caeni]|uniref:Bulb-type lectin domain-containing protein n=1 Tax=Parachitinimonas caeni TaxID=3031301 RepID=A0ABT7DVH1_9NEIS|nr:hypothetical protein [Parachitinimonas caeni]MDK2124066.1 hypothetical protein [Parachitinimonas caeni]